MAGETRPIDQGGFVRPAVLQGALQREQRAIQVPRASVTPSAQERDAILDSLYAERGRLTRARRLGELTAAEQEYLEELELYIDHWEADEMRAAASDDVWHKLDELASSLLSVHSEIARTDR